MNAQQLDRFTVVELAVDELGSWIDTHGGDQQMRDDLWKVSQWLHRKLTLAQGLEARRDRMIKIRSQLTELFPLDDTDK